MGCCQASSAVTRVHEPIGDKPASPSAVAPQPTDDHAPEEAASSGKGTGKGKPAGKAGKGGGPPPPPPRSGAAASPKAKAQAGRPPAQAVALAPGASIADQLSQRREQLRAVEQAPSSESAARSPAEGGESEEQAALRSEQLRSLVSLATQTALGSIASGRVAAAQQSAGTPLGRGRFASVVRAAVRGDGDGDIVEVAAKRFSAKVRAVEGGEVAAVPLSAVRSARREVEALLAVAPHPNVVELLGVVVPALEPAPSAVGTLEESIQESPPLQLLLRPSHGCLTNLVESRSDWEALQRAGRLSVLADAVRGLAALHAAGFAHLDVKSRNILVDRDDKGAWVARVCDLGAARHVGRDGRGGSPRSPTGTSGWTAPEVLLEDAAGGAPDPRTSDVFSCGVLIWEVSTGPDAQNPLSGLAGSDYCKAVADGKRPAFSEDAAGTEEPVLAAECWQLAPESRPQLAEVELRLTALKGAASTKSKL